MAAWSDHFKKKIETMTGRRLQSKEKRMPGRMEKGKD
jgi:hypothetical protein